MNSGIGGEKKKKKKKKGKGKMSGILSVVVMAGWCERTT
jgi:hypothetical protein